MKILITGANGQLGQELNQLASIYPEIQFLLYTKHQWDISNQNESEQILTLHKPDFLINTAAYTKVDQAEDEPELCFKINADAPTQLSVLCKAIGTQLIHISTDYVFNSTTRKPILENEPKNPIGVYAVSKSKGEDGIMQSNPNSIIVRTSWLYSSFGHNFVKTMYKLSKSRKSLNIVADQVGNPTYAKNLAACLIHMMLQLKDQNHSNFSGYYHFCNQGNCSWYDFAAEIFKYLNIDIHLNQITTAEYGAKAWRPLYSSLDCTKIQHSFKFEIPHWKQSLHECLDLIRFEETKLMS